MDLNVKVERQVNSANPDKANKKISLIIIENFNLIKNIGI